MSRNFAGALACGLGTVLAAAAFAQDTDGLNVDLGECVELESPEERFTCYESRVEAAREQSDSAAQPPERAESPNEATSDGRAASAEGVTERPRSGGAASEDGAQPKEIVGTIENLEERLPNTYVITLDNDEVWLQTVPKFYPLRPGQTVRLRSTGWGTSYRLSTEERGSFIQVERVR